jgi:hypothetical protein
MTDAATDRYADWKAPAEDGSVLLWPAADEVLADAARNHALLSNAETLVQGVPLPDLRRQLRAWIGHADEDKLLFTTGHQAELHHPGVWAKNALIDAAATRAGGSAYHVAVDTDEPKHLRLRWPGFAGESISDDESLGHVGWTACLRPPTPAHVERLRESLWSASASWGYEPPALDFLDTLRRSPLDGYDLAAELTRASHALDWSLGLRHHALTVSPLLESEPYLIFVYHVIARAGRFAADYNAALDDYRTEHRVRTPGRPMPNLRAEAMDAEVPFWSDDLVHGVRSRAKVTKHFGGAWSLVGTTPGQFDDVFTFHADADARTAARELKLWLRRNNVRLSPRALTLTMFLRLFLADQFAHGIGGARYDQVADRLIRRHFHLQPPRFCVTTATLYFPQALGRTKACLSCVKQEGHRLRHNVIGGAEKRELVEAIAAAPRRSSERSRLFSRLHEQLDAASSDPAIRAWQQRLADTARDEALDRDLFDRELFYAIQPTERLKELIERYRAKFGG